jgi:hypothetical protein
MDHTIPSTEGGKFRRQDQLAISLNMKSSGVRQGENGSFWSGNLPTEEDISWNNKRYLAPI